MNTIQQRSRRHVTSTVIAVIASIVIARNPQKDLDHRISVVVLAAHTSLRCDAHVTVGYLSFGPIENIYVFCDLSVREKDWRSRAQDAEPCVQREAGELL